MMFHPPYIGLPESGELSKLSSAQIVNTLLCVGYFLFMLFKYSSVVINGIFQSLKSFVFFVIRTLNPESKAL